MKRFVIGLLIVSLSQSFAFAQKKPDRPQVQTPAVYRGLADPSAPPDPPPLPIRNGSKSSKTTGFRN